MELNTKNPRLSSSSHYPDDRNSNLLRRMDSHIPICTELYSNRLGWLSIVTHCSCNAWGPCTTLIRGSVFDWVLFDTTDFDTTNHR